MQKKVLIPVLMAMPVAMPAMANINIGFPLVSSWDQEGLVSTSGDLITSATGAGYVEQTLNIPHGKYRLIFNSCENIAVYVGDSTTEATLQNSGNGTKNFVEFFVEGDEGIYIKIAAKTPDQAFSFEGLKLVLFFNSNETIADLKATLSELKAMPKQVGDDDTFSQAAELRKQLTVIETKLTNYVSAQGTTPFTTVWKEIKKLGGASANSDQSALLDIYKKYGFNQDVPAIQAYLNNLKAYIAEYNTAVEAENQAWLNYQNNVNTREELLNGVQIMQNGIDEIKDELNNWQTVAADVKAPILAEAEDLLDEIEAYEQAIKTAYPINNTDKLRETIDATPLTDKFAELKAEVNALVGKLSNFQQGYDVYYNVNFMLIPELTNAYNAYKKAVDEAAGVAGYTTVYDKEKSKLLADALKKYNNIKDNNLIPKVENGEDVDPVAYNKQHECTLNLTTAIEEFKQATEAYKNMVATQNAAMTEALKQIKEYNDDIEYYGTLMMPKQYQQAFAEQLGEINTAVADLQKYVVAQYNKHALNVVNNPYAAKVGNIDALIDGMDNIVSDAQALSDAFQQASATIDEFESAFATLEDFVKDKKIDEVPEVANLKASFTAQYLAKTGSFNQKIADYNQRYLWITGVEDAQTCLDQINELNDLLNDETLLNDMNVAKETFAKAATDANIDYAQHSYDALNLQIQSAINRGVTGADELAKNKDLQHIANALKSLHDNVIPGYGTDTVKLGKADDQIVKYLDMIAGFGAQLKALEDNQAAYDELVTDVVSLQTELTQVMKVNENTSEEPGRAYYLNQVFPGIQAKIDQLLNTDLPKSLKAQTAVADRAVDKTGFDARIKAIGLEIKDTRAAIDANNLNHNNQLAREKEIRAYIDKTIERIKANTNAASLREVQDWIAGLESLRDNDIVKANKTVTEAYGNGASEAQNEAIMAEYDRIMEEAQGFESNYDNDLNQAVKKANASTTQGWSELVEGLWDQYKNGVRTYNYLYFDQKNPGWKAFLEASEVLKRHQTLFQYYDIINTLNEEEAAKLLEWNNANHVITADEWQVWVDMANKVKSDILADVNSLLAATDAQAIKYYEQQKDKASTALAEATEALNAAGITLDFLAVASGYYETAETLYNFAGDHKSLRMDEIADELDKVYGTKDVKSAIQLQEFAEKAWASKFEKAQKDIQNLRDEIGTYRLASDEVKEAVNASFTQVVSEINDLNAKANAVTEDFVKVYKDYAEALDGMLETLGTYRDEVKKSNDVNVENQIIYDRFYSDWMPEMNSAYRDLSNYCNSLGGCVSMEQTLDQIRQSIDALKKLVDAQANSLATLDIDNKCQELLDNIAATYGTAFNLEVNYLRNTLLKNTKIAFNDAKVKGGVLPEGYTFDGVDREIESIILKINKLVYVAEDKETLKDQALDIENDLCSIYNMLITSWESGLDSAADILSNLNDRYAELSAAIAEGEAFLNECYDEVKEKYAGKYIVLNGQLEAEKKDWSDDGVHIIAREAYYQTALDALKAQIDALGDCIEQDQAAAQAEADKQKASNDRYTVLKAEYDGLAQLFEETKTIVAGYPGNIAKMYAATAKNIENMLAASLKELEAAKANYALTATSKLPQGDAIKAAINDYKLAATHKYAEIELEATGKAAAEASNKLATLSIVPADYTVLSAEYKKANKDYQGLLDDERYADFDELNDIIEDARKLAETFASISERATENSYVLGDVNLDEDGEVNVLDVQMLISMVAQGDTYEEVYDENPRQACAADITGDKTLNIADVTALIQLILGDDVSVVKVAAAMPAVSAQGGLTIAPVEEADGVRRYALILNGGVPFTGCQYDIRVSGNASVVGVATSERSADHDAYLYDGGLGNYRVVMASMQNSVFAGSDGVIAYIDVEGEGELTIENALFSDTKNIVHEMGRAHTSSIDALLDYCKDGVKRIYDAAGRSYDRLQRGINIILHKDGSVTKELRK